MRCIEVEDPGHSAVDDNAVVRREITVNDDLSGFDRRKPPLDPTRDVERRERVMKPPEEHRGRANGLVGREDWRERVVGDLALQEAHRLGLEPNVGGDQPRNSDEPDPFEMREHMVDRSGVRTHRTYHGSTDTKDAIHTSREFLTLIRPCVHPIDPRTTSQRERATRTLPTVGGACSTTMDWRRLARRASRIVAAVSRQIVVSGGAGYWCGPEGSRLDDYALELTGTARPRVCAVCTASGDSESYLRGFYEQFQDRCEVSHLPLFVPPFEDPADLLSRQDLIYVGGGSTANMLAVWRLHGIDRLLSEALDRGTILYGSSAGGICWYESGLTDSLSFDGTLRPLTNGLGLLTGSHAPHFDRPGRRNAYTAMVADGRLHNGIGIDDFAAVHYVDGEIHAVVATRPDASASVVTSDGRSGATVIELATMLR